MLKESEASIGTLQGLSNWKLCRNVIFISAILDPLPCPLRGPVNPQTRLEQVWLSLCTDYPPSNSEKVQFHFYSRGEYNAREPSRAFTSMFALQL